MDIRQRTLDAVERRRKAAAEYHRLEFDEDDPAKLGPPATQDELRRAQTILGTSLPPSYAAFLSLHSGWQAFTGETNLYAAAELGSPDYSKRKQEFRDLLAEFDASALDWFDRSLLVGAGTHFFLALDPQTQRPDGETDVISYDMRDGELDRNADFAEYLEQSAELLESMAQEA